MDIVDDRLVYGVATVLVLTTYSQLCLEVSSVSIFLVTIKEENIHFH